MDEPRRDTVHFTVAGYQDVGRRFADAARELIYLEPIDARPALVEARAAALGGELEIELDAPVSGGETALFRVRDVSGNNAVTQVSVVGNVVTLDPRGPSWSA